MKKQTLKLTTILLALIFTFSCNDNSQEIQKLKKENEELRAELKTARTLIPEYSFRAIVLPNKRTIKLGEEYKAYVGLVAVDKKRPPVAINCIIKDDQVSSYGDTLVYNPEYEMSEYKIKPTKTGTFKWDVTITQRNPIDGTFKSYVAESEYTVNK